MQLPCIHRQRGPRVPGYLVRQLCGRHDDGRRQACPNSDIEVYEALAGAGDTSGGNDYGEGERYVGTTTTDGSGDFTFVTTAFAPNDAVSAIVIDATDNTSEFSANKLVVNDADLVLTKVLDPSTPGPFVETDTVTYLLTVTNNGPVQATSVTTTDTYPAELTLGTATPSAPTTYDSGTGVWDIGTLAVSASATLTLTGTVNAGTAGDVVTNSVSAANADQTDPTATGDDLNEVFTVLPFLSIDDVTQLETDSGTTTFTFTVTINQAVGATTSPLTLIRRTTRRRLPTATTLPSAAAAAR